MIHFKHLKPGMSLIEVMAAIAILAIFGTSLFLMQQYLFERMTVSQAKLIANLHMQSQLVEYQTKIVKELLEQNQPIEKVLLPHTKNFTHPEMIIKINAKSNIGSFLDGDDQQKNSFKIFKNLYLITAQAEQNSKELSKSYTFMYVPGVAQP